VNDVVRILPGLGDRDADAMIECARAAGLDCVTIVGWSGDEFFFSTSYNTCRDTLWDLKQAEMRLLSE
jgi:hypothetical protein